jgi:hypothetical protein
VTLLSSVGRIEIKPIEVIEKLWVHLQIKKFKI